MVIINQGNYSHTMNKIESIILNIISIYILILKKHFRGISPQLQNKTM